jgi:phosphoribosylaminoimidazolecarboxamide formyltransferase/IMP cyclohydrolase
MAIKANAAPPQDLVPVRRALLSVFDKTGLAAFAAALAARGVEIVSTGGTAAALAAAGIPVVDVSALTGFPEILDGRVKTLHPAVHGGLLAVRGDKAHEAALAAHGIAPIDLLVVNLYPFERVAASGASFAETVENIDIGGPAMIRAAAKNHASVAVVTDPANYAQVLAALAADDGALPLALRQRLAAAAYARTATYDAAISRWFAGALAIATPRDIALAGRLAETLRYGENPHQTAALYLTGDNRPGAATARRLQGKELSYNNINDTDAAFELASEFDPAASAAVVIVKHANPCGVATAPTLLEAWQKALACDPVSAFGGIVAVNRELDGEAARAIAAIFTEVVIAPLVGEEARAVFAAKKNLRLLETGAMADARAAGLAARTVAGGLLVQSRDAGLIDDIELKTVTRRAPDARELADLKFAFRVAKHVKSNAIVYARDGATVGIGAGQMSRVDSSRIAALKAAESGRAAGLAQSPAIGSVAASDAFFPFADGLLAAVEAGASAVIQPGGSMRDAEVIAAADKAGIAMVFTGIRHFRH